MDHIEFDPPIDTLREQFPGKGLKSASSGADLVLTLLQELAAMFVLYGTTIIRIDEAEIPQFGPLVDIWDPGHGHFQQVCAES